MKRLSFAPEARADLIAIGLFIAQDNPERAESFISELEAKAVQVAERPRSFPARDDVSPGLRAASHGRYLLFFRELPDTVRVVRAIHGSRDLKRIFRA